MSQLALSRGALDTTLMVADMLARQRRQAASRRNMTMAFARTAHGLRNMERAANTIGRAYRTYKKVRGKYKGFNRARIGLKPTEPTNAKTHQASNDDADLKSTRTLYNYDLTNIPLATGINARLRQQVYLAGVNICFQWENEGSQPYTMNFAVVHDKQSNNSVTSVNTNDFFRTIGATSRNTDFSITLTNNEMHCLALNTDRFTVLKHVRELIAPPGTPTVYSTNRESYGQMNMYIPIKRKVTYEDNHCQSKIWVLYWFDRFQAPAGEVVASNVVKISQHFKVYFREPILGA